MWCPVKPDNINRSGPEYRFLSPLSKERRPPMKKRRLTGLLCAFALLCVLALPALGSSGGTTVYLLAANDKFCDLPGDVRPVAVDGTVYIPYSIFDKDITGVDLGVYYGIDQAGDTILNLYSLNGMLTFSLKMGICKDNQDNTMDFWALTRSGIPYVPAAAVCRFFGLNYSFLPTSDRGTLIRISNANASLSDSLFLTSASNGMSIRYNNILQGLAPLATPTPAPVPTPTATPAPEGSKGNIRVYLAVDASTAQEDLTALFPSGVRGLFLFTPDSLARQSALVRQVVARGHSVGLIVSGSLAEAQAQLEEGNRLLSHIARIKTRIVSAPAALTAGLTAGGWSCWQANTTGSTATALLSGLEAKRSVGRLTLPANASIVSRVISQVRSDGYTLRQPLETEL